MRLGLGNTLVNNGLSNPDLLSLDLNFAADKTLAARKGPTPAFVRSSTGTYVGSDGLLATAALNVARFDHEPLSPFTCKGLLIEESRENIILNSDTLGTQSVTVTAIAHTLSFYGEGQVILSGVAAATVTGSGSYPTRTTYTFTPTAGTLVLTVTGSVRYANLERVNSSTGASFATSYIPTTSGAATRSADLCEFTGSAFTSFYNQPEGTILSSSSMPSIPSVNSLAYAFDDTSNNERHDFRHNTTFQVTQVSGATQAQFSGTAPAAGSVTKFAAAYKVADYAAAKNGTLLTSSSGSFASVPTTTQVYVGSKRGASEFLNGHVQYIKVFKKRLTNAKLQSLTT